MSTHARRTASWLAPLLLLLVVGAGVTAAYTVTNVRLGSAGPPFPLIPGACFLAALIILVRCRRPDAWRSSIWLGLGVLAIAGISLSFLVAEPTGSLPAAIGPYEVAFMAVGVLFLVAVAVEFRQHMPREDRREIASDIALLSAAIGTMLFLYLRPSGTDPLPAASAASLALIVATGFSAYGTLALARPTLGHLGMFGAVCGLCYSVLVFAPRWLEGSFETGTLEIDLAVALSVLLLAIVTSVVPRRAAEEHPDPMRYSRAVLTTLSVAASCGALGLVAQQEIEGEIGLEQASMLIAVLAAAVALRILVNQVRTTQQQRAVVEALAEKEGALSETDQAVGRLQLANETLRESEERLRAVFEAAVDGIVELDQKDVIVRANSAFCSMMELPQSLIEGHAWTAVAASVRADEQFSTLPTTGQGTLHREGQPIYLESRTSEIPGDPPRRLLLVRDVTKARIADQTIRSLFKFLQDRDEDRTRIMRRTNAAIESERNRIARDLHDGPVQGVSAASLSLEAVLLMLRAGDLDEGYSVLAKVRAELSEEADNLRRLMSGLRPPLLEERGLIPALRETLDRYGREHHVRTEFRGHSSADIPPDLETLAYRVVQEAMANSAKHSSARSMNVSVETSGGQLRVEIADDGIGFDSAKAREYLQSGRVGLASMRERVELANGTFMVHSAPGRGTTVLASLPLDAVPAPREFSVSEAS